MVSKSSSWPIAGGLLTALAAGLCCAGPLVLVMLGIGGSWVSNLTLLDPYRPLFILLTVALFAVAGWQLHRPADNCVTGTECAPPRVRRRRRIIFWLAAFFALAIVTSNYWIVWLV